MLSIVSAVREGCFDRLLQAERQFLKLFFAFDHIHSSRYKAYQHLFLTNLRDKKHQAYQDLVVSGSGCTTTNDSKFATKHGDLETEHFRSGYSTNIHKLLDKDESNLCQTTKSG